VRSAIRDALSFLVAAGLSALSMACTYFLLPKEEGTVPTVEVAGPGGRRPSAFASPRYSEYFRRPELRGLYLPVLPVLVRVLAVLQRLRAVAERRFVTSHFDTALMKTVLEPWSAREVGYLFAYSGLIGILWQGGLIGRMVKRFGELKLTAAGFGASVVAYIAFGFVRRIA